VSEFVLSDTDSRGLYWMKDH